MLSSVDMFWLFEMGKGRMRWAGIDLSGGARSVCVRPPERAVSEAASPAPNISTAHLSLSASFHFCLCLIFHIRIGLSILFDLFLLSALFWDFPSAYHHIALVFGFLQLPNDWRQNVQSLTMFSGCLFNSSLYDSCCDKLSAKWRIHDARRNLPAVWTDILMSFHMLFLSFH